MGKNQSVTRAFTILEHLAKADGMKDLAAISKDLNMNKSTVYRFLSSMAEQGYVHQDEESGRYALGAKVTWLASKFLEGVEVRHLAHSVLKELSLKTNETVHLGLLDGFEVVYIDKVDGNGAIRMASRIGGRMPIHCTALGKAIFASHPEDQWRDYVLEGRLIPRTSQTLTEPELFYEEIYKVRQLGYAIDDCENEDGIRCIAAPIRDYSEKVYAALSVSGWTKTMTHEKIAALAPELVRSALEISNRMGSHGNEAAVDQDGKEVSIG